MQIVQERSGIHNYEISMKQVARNTFTVATLTSTVGILGFTCKGMDQIDIKIRKTIAMSVSFHPNSNLNRLYFSRKDARRDIRAIRTMNGSRKISICQHLRNIQDQSEIQKYI